MSQRLENLKRQKQLIEEHLRWLDAEIVAETGVSWESPREEETIGPGSIAPFPTSTPQSQTSETTPTTVFAREAENESEGEDTDLEDLSEQLISQYSHVSARREMDPRLSLMLIFGGLLGSIALVIFLFYWFGYR